MTSFDHSNSRRREFEKTQRAHVRTQGSFLRARPLERSEPATLIVDRSVMLRLIWLLNHPEFDGMSYSTFINRACELAEAELDQ